MKPSFILGIVGGIFAILVALFEFGIGALGSAFGVANSGQLYALSGLTLVSGIVGICGGAIGNKVGGGLMIVSGIFALIGATLFGVLPFILLLIGGIFALRENTPVTQPIQQPNATGVPYPPPPPPLEKKNNVTLVIGVLLLIVLFVVFAAVIASYSGSTNSTINTINPTSNPTTVNQVQIQVQYSGSWSGSYGDVGSIVSWSGDGPKNITLSRPSDSPYLWIVSANAIKLDSSTDTLTVSILRMDGTVLKTASTESAYGMAQVAVNVTG